MQGYEQNVTQNASLARHGEKFVSLLQRTGVAKYLGGSTRQSEYSACIQALLISQIDPVDSALTPCRRASTTYDWTCTACHAESRSLLCRCCTGSHSRVFLREEWNLQHLRDRRVTAGCMQAHRLPASIDCRIEAGPGNAGQRPDVIGK